MEGESMFCARCGRPLKSKRSIAKHFGAQCLKLYNQQVEPAPKQAPKKKEPTGYFV